MFFILQTTVTMTSLPIVNEHFRILCFVTEGLRETTVIFVCVSENDAAKVRDEKTGFTQTRAQCFDCFFGFGSGVDDRQRIFGDQVDVDRTNIERRRQRYRNDPHVSTLSAANRSTYSRRSDPPRYAVARRPCLSAVIS